MDLRFLPKVNMAVQKAVGYEYITGLKIASYLE